MLLGYIAENIGNRPYKELVGRHVFKRAGMSKSGIDLEMRGGQKIYEVVICFGCDEGRGFRTAFFHCRNSKKKRNRNDCALWSILGSNQ